MVCRRESPSFRRTSYRELPLDLALLVLILVALSGCDSAVPPQGAEPDTPWPQSAIVVDLSYGPSSSTAGPDLATLKAIGFDTVLLDPRAGPTPWLVQRIEAARAQQLRVLIQLDRPDDAAAPPPDGGHALRKEVLKLVDGLLLTIRGDADLTSARALRDAKPGTVLIAQIPAARQTNDRSTGDTLPTEVFDAVLIEDASTDLLALLDRGGTLSPTAFAERHPVATETQADHDGLPQWVRLPHCDLAEDQPCSEDIRLLVMGFLQGPVPVTGVIENSFWQEVYRSLIRLRRQSARLRAGKRGWYAADDDAGVLAYRFTNDARHQLLVAINVSDTHHELPLPFGFMADSKVRLWASYDPAIHEIVTSRPVMLPARSAVVVLYD